ncbi:signal peptidase II [Thermosulfuriphilus sp.]
MERRGLGLFLSPVLVVYLLDQASKAWALKALVQGPRVLIPGLLDLTLVENTGAAFGFLAGEEGWRHYFFVTVSLLALAMIVWIFVTAKDRPAVLALGTGLVFGGALGNLTDRIRFHRVIDFIDVHWTGYHWPAFNIADSAITVGGCLLAYYFLSRSRI